MHSSNILYYENIKDLLAATGISADVTDSSFYCLRLDQIDQDIYSPPFRRGFFFLALLTTANNSQIAFDNTKLANVNSVLIFQPPNLIYSFYRHSTTKGYIIYFKPACFTFYKPDINNEFPFFSQHNAHHLELDTNLHERLRKDFEDIFRTFENNPTNNYTPAKLKLLTLLYELKNLTAFDTWKNRNESSHAVLLRKYIQLVNYHYLEKRTVNEYAHLLSVTPNHLSQSVKAVTGKNALAFINDRLSAEAESMIAFTHLDVSEIAHRLNFSDPANFHKFFKKRFGLSPLEFRRQVKN